MTHPRNPICPDWLVRLRAQRTAREAVATIKEAYQRMMAAPMDEVEAELFLERLNEPARRVN